MLLFVIGQYNSTSADAKRCLTLSRVRLSTAFFHNYSSVLAIKLCVLLMSFCSRDLLSPSVPDQEESALQSSEERHPRQEDVQMGAQSYVSSVHCSRWLLVP